MRSLFILSAFLILPTGAALACDTCGCSFNAKAAEPSIDSGPMVLTPTANTLGKGHGSVGFLFEHQRFNSIPAANAHTFHHQGIGVHGKDHEEFYNLSAGFGVLDDLDLYLAAPIVSKTSIEVEDDDRLGAKDTATGFGDMRLIGKYRFWHRGVDAAFLLGLKAPTGATSKKSLLEMSSELSSNPVPAPGI